MQHIGTVSPAAQAHDAIEIAALARSLHLLDHLNQAHPPGGADEPVGLDGVMKVPVMVGNPVRVESDRRVAGVHHGFGADLVVVVFHLAE